MKDRGSPIRVSKYAKDFLENTRATRRSNAVGTDKEQLNQREVLDLIVSYFKSKGDRFVELLKMEYKKNV